LQQGRDGGWPIEKRWKLDAETTRLLYNYQDDMEKLSQLFPEEVFE